MSVASLDPAAILEYATSNLRIERILIQLGLDPNNVTYDAIFDRIPGAPDDHVYGFALVPPDTLWLHRMGALEAFRWDGKQLSRFISVGTDAGLPAVESGGLLADRSGALWLTTTRGLLRYDPVGERLRMFGVRDGLPSHAPSRAAS